MNDLDEWLVLMLSVGLVAASIYLTLLNLCA